MTSGILIRRAIAEDAPALHAAIHALSRHLGDEHKFTAVPEDYLAYGFGEWRLFQAIVAEAEEGLCAAAMFFPEFSTHRGRPGVFVQDLWVAEERRGGGLGRRMLAAVLHEARAWQAVYMKLSAHATNPVAVRFYERLGFATDREEMVFVIEGDGLARLEGDA